jgi:hypothetical protein
MRHTPALAAAALTALAVAGSASANHTPRFEPVAYAACDTRAQPDVVTRSPLDPHGDRLGPLWWNGRWAGYAEWANMESVRDPQDGTNYAKNPMYARAPAPFRPCRSRRAIATRRTGPTAWDRGAGEC